MHLDIIDRPDDPKLEAFHAAYRGAFVLPNETEELAGFQACLALNHGGEYERLRVAYGPFSETCLIAREAPDGAMIGGANLIALHHVIDGRSVLTANLNYIFVQPAARGQGWFSRLVRAVAGVIPAMLGVVPEPTAGVFIFVEQNDPLRMDPATYAIDSAHSGLDPFDRLRIWANRGARVLDFPYVQPALSADQAPDEGLVYGVMGTDGATLDSCLLASHLRGFFGISVLKGTALADDAVASAQLDTLDMACRRQAPVALLDAREALRQLDAEAEHALVRRGGALRDWLRGLQPSNVA